MSRFIIAYVATAVVFLGVDMIWLGFAAQRLYRPILGELMIDGFRPVPAVAFYLIYVLGLVVMAVIPALREGLWYRATLTGAMLGFFAYATYDLTNQATLKNWSTLITLADMGWGTFVSAVGATAGYAVATWLAPRAAG